MTRPFTNTINLPAGYIDDHVASESSESYVESAEQSAGIYMNESWNLCCLYAPRARWDQELNSLFKRLSARCRTDAGYRQGNTAVGVKVWRVPGPSALRKKCSAPPGFRLFFLKNTLISKPLGRCRNDILGIGRVFLLFEIEFNFFRGQTSARLCVSHGYKSIQIMLFGKS